MRREISGTSGTGDIRCPFFIAHGNREILCQCHLPDGKSVTIRWETAAMKDQQQHLFCEGQYKYCPHYMTVIHFDWEDD